MRSFQTIRWEGEGIQGHCVIVDQTKLPGEFVEIELKTEQDAWNAIKVLAVRGAPAIGVAGAYGMVLGMRDATDDNFLSKLEDMKDYLDSSRPTAVNLSWATSEMYFAGNAAFAETGEARAALAVLLEKAQYIQKDDEERCASIGKHGADLVPDHGACLTHCNAGALATAGDGTALSVFYAAQRQGKDFKVFADETRPLNQGGRLTAWELHSSNIDVTVICDSMAAFLMSKQKIDLIVVGSDRIAANGDIANKIGTYGLAILAKEHGVPFYVAAPLSTFDMKLATGSEIPIEERAPEEITTSNGKMAVGEGIKVWNPAFDITPASYIQGIITEKGVLEKDSENNFRSSIIDVFEKAGR